MDEVWAGEQGASGGEARDGVVCVTRRAVAQEFGASGGVRCTPQTRTPPRRRGTRAHPRYAGSQRNAQNSHAEGFWRESALFFTVSDLTENHTTRQSRELN